MDITSFLDSIRLTPKVAGSVFLFSVVVFLLPRSLLNALAINELRDQYAPWLGVSVLLSGSVLIAHAVAPTARWVRNRFDYYRALRRGRRHLSDLTPSEREILKRYMDANTRSRSLSAEDGTVACLVADHILYRPTRFVRAGLSIEADYVLDTWAWKHLHKHPELID